MLDTSTSAHAIQRAEGTAHVALSCEGRTSRLTRLRQQGCAKAFLPRVPAEPEIVFLNTAGGLTGGDTLSYALELGPRAAATATTQTAERAYAATADGAPARLDVRIGAGAGARVDWLPQETILYDGARLDRTTRIALGRGASVLTCEAVVLGRAAMGETVRRAQFFDRREILREGRLLLVDSVALDDAALGLAGAAPGLAAARAVALVALVEEGAEAAVSALRAVSLPDEVVSAASGWDGRCVVRLMAPDGWPLRVALAALLRHLRARRGSSGALPRVWQI